MPEPRSRRDTPYDIYGILAEFKEPDDLVKAAKRAKEDGFRSIDAFSPFPIAGLAEEIGFRDRRVPIATLIGGIVGAVIGYGLQVYANVDYPLNVGGRPIIASTAFMLITFELLVLFAALFGTGAMFVCNRLPRLHHPLFEVDTFHLASLDKFFLVIFSNDARFDPARTRCFLQSLDPECIRDVPFTGAPE